MSITNNKRYRELKVREGEYVPDIGMDYPEDDPLVRLVPTKIVKHQVFDENYPFVDRSFKGRIHRIFANIFINRGIVAFLNRVLFGIRFEGRDVLRRYRKELKDGAISVSNHCYPYDGVAVSCALRRWVWTPMLPDHINGPSRFVLRGFGGIPLAEPTLSAQKKFNDTFDDLHRRKQWILIFPEARSWFFYKPVRPFMKGAFSMAYKWNCPIVPVNISFRPRTGIYKLFQKANVPLLTVRIGEPIFPNPEAPRKVEVDRLQEAAHSAVCSLAGIEHNPWPYKWNEN